MTKLQRITERQADAFLKRVFSRRSVLAALLKALFPEFRDIDIDDIARNYLLPQGDSELVQICHPDGGACQYDIVFKSLRPGYTSSRDCIVFNIEFQNKINPGYAIIKRGIYYSSKILCQEKGSLFEGSDYDGLRKVHGFWLCPRAPASSANSIRRYNLLESVTGEAVEQIASPKEDYDMIALTIVALNDDIPPKSDRGLRLLYTLINSTLPSEERERILKEEYSLETTTEEKQMHSFFYYQMKDCKKKGREEGRKEGRMEGRMEGREEGRMEGRMEGREEGEKLGLQKGITKAYRSITQNLLSLGKNAEEIQSLLAIPHEEVTSIIGTIQTGD